MLLTTEKKRFHDLLVKYPNNEALLSVKHLVVIEPKQLKKKQKIISKIKCEDTTHNSKNNVSYPLIKSEDTTHNTKNNVSYPLITYEDTKPSNIKYEIIE